MCVEAVVIFVLGLLGVVAVSVAVNLVFCSGVRSGCPFVVGCCSLLLT
jgi:hypothetical protein